MRVEDRYRATTGTVLALSDNGVMLCPFCSDDLTHVDEISAGYFPGDDYDQGATSASTATFNATNGEVRQGPMTDLRYSDRRHWVEIHIDCEVCHGGTLVLGQCKGFTEIYLVPTVKTSVRVSRS